MRLPLVDVAVSVLRAPDGSVLLAERTAGQIAAGFWELPGGKIDPGETPVQAAARELNEEIGIQAQGLRPWIVYEHAFRTRRVRLHFFRVQGWQGQPHGREGQRLAWVDPAAPVLGPVLPSNERALLALALPSVYALSDSRAAGGLQPVLSQLQAALARGLRLILVREDAMSPDQRVTFARRIAGLAAPYGARVMLAGTALQAHRAGAVGVHSRACELRRMSARPDVRLWSASCHDAADLARAVDLGADFAVLSPVLPTASHPEQAALGWDGLQRLAAAAPIAVYAQGGMSPALVSQAQDAGAVGVALGAAAWAHAAFDVPLPGR